MSASGIPFILYRKDSGQIIMHGTIGRIEWARPPDEDHATMQAGDDVTGDTHRVVADAIVAKGASTATCYKTTVAANGTDVVTLAALPQPCQVNVVGPHVRLIDVPDGTLELTFTEPGDYVVTVISTPQLQKTFTIHAS